MLGFFNLKCLLIEFVIPNLGQIYFCIQEIFKNDHLKSFFGFVLMGCKFTKVILQFKSQCEMFAFWYTNNIKVTIFYAVKQLSSATIKKSFESFAGLYRKLSLWELLWTARHGSVLTLYNPFSYIFSSTFNVK